MDAIYLTSVLIFADGDFIAPSDVDRFEDQKAQFQRRGYLLQRAPHNESLPPEAWWRSSVRGIEEIAGSIIVQ